MKTVILDVRDRGEAMKDLGRVWRTRKPEKSARISFAVRRAPIRVVLGGALVRTWIAAPGSGSHDGDCVKVGPGRSGAATGPS